MIHGLPWVLCGALVAPSAQAEPGSPVAALAGGTSKPGVPGSSDVPGSRRYRLSGEVEGMLLRSAAGTTAGAEIAVSGRGGSMFESRGSEGGAWGPAFGVALGVERDDLGGLRLRYWQWSREDARRERIPDGTIAATAWLAARRLDLHCLRRFAGGRLIVAAGPTLASIESRLTADGLFPEAGTGSLMEAGTWHGSIGASVGLEHTIPWGVGGMRTYWGGYGAVLRGVTDLDVHMEVVDRSPQTSFGATGVGTNDGRARAAATLGTADLTLGFEWTRGEGPAGWLTSVRVGARYTLMRTSGALARFFTESPSAALRNDVVGLQASTVQVIGISAAVRLGL